MLKFIPLPVLATAVALGFLAAPGVQAAILDQTLHGVDSTPGRTARLHESDQVDCITTACIENYGLRRQMLQGPVVHEVRTSRNDALIQNGVQIPRLWAIHARHRSEVAMQAIEVVCHRRMLRAVRPAER